MPETYYRYEVTLASGRKEKFRTSKAYTVLEDIECLNEDGTVCGRLTINEDLVESVFVKKVEPSITKEQEETLDWVDKVDQSPKQEPYMGIPMMGDDGEVFTIYVEQ